MKRNLKILKKSKDGLVSDFCIVCTPRSGSYYLMEYMCKTFGLTEGNEWFGRNKAVDLSVPFELKQTRLDIDWTVNEDLLTPEEIQNRLNHLQNFPVPFCIKAMPLQFTNTIEQVDLPKQERIEFALEILKQFDLIWFQRKDKISHFCFELTAMACSQPDYPRDREFSMYDPEKRATPKPQSFTATEKDFEKYIFREEFTDELMSWFDAPQIIYEDFIEDRDACIMEVAEWYDIKPDFKEENKREIIHNPDYTEIFTNYKEIETWFR